MWMLCVTIPWDLTNALVKMDMREMEPTAQVSHKPRYQTTFSQLKKFNFQTNWCKLGCFRQETQYCQPWSYWLNRRRHETSKIAGRSLSEHYSKTFGVLIVLFVSSFIWEILWSVIICEGGKRTISCDNDQRTIDVVDANYGRLDSNTCHHSAVSDTNCKAANSLFIVRLKCNEEASCELHADSLVFGDPCLGTYKYLEVKYKCVNLG